MGAAHWWWWLFVLLTVPGTGYILNIRLLDKQMNACRLVILQLFPSGSHCQFSTQVTCSEVTNGRDPKRHRRHRSYTHVLCHWCQFHSWIQGGVTQRKRQAGKKGEGWAEASNSCSLGLGTSVVNLITLITYWVSSCSMSYFPATQYVPWEWRLCLLHLLLRHKHLE